jgi:hypothetical protein
MIDPKGSYDVRPISYLLPLLLLVVVVVVVVVVVGVLLPTSDWATDPLGVPI